MFFAVYVFCGFFGFETGRQVTDLGDFRASGHCLTSGFRIRGQRIYVITWFGTRLKIYGNFTLLVVKFWLPKCKKNVWPKMGPQKPPGADIKAAPHEISWRSRIRGQNGMFRPWEVSFEGFSFFSVFLN